MKNLLKQKIWLFSSISILLFAQSCKKEPTATKILMQGNWELVEAYDENGNDILTEVSFPITALQLTDDNGMVGTQGPMFTRIVYGPSKWIEVSAKIKQVFDYANFRFNTGEFFLDGGIQERFTVEAKLQATAAAGGLKDILEILGVGNAYFQQVIYHRFVGVKVEFPNQDLDAFEPTANEGDIMIWEFDNETQALYNYRDANGNFVAWLGWPVENFQKGRYVFQKRTQGVNEMVSSKL